jgi:hypothetical protein
MSTIETNTITKENLLPEFKMSSMAIPFGIVLLVLTILLFILLFNQGFSFSKPESKTSTKTANEITKDVFIVLTFLLICGGLLFLLLPKFKDNIHQFLEQISNTVFVFIYTIFFIIFFLTVPGDTLNKYGYIITPLTLLLTAYMFYKGSSTNYIENFNINYERIKTIILFLCLITITIVYYSVDPGGFISKYYGSTLLLTILLGVFSLLYLIIVLTLPDTIKPVDTTSKSSNFLENFSKFSVYGSMLFILFLIIVVYGIYKYPGGIKSNKQILISISVLLLLILTIWGSGLLVAVFPEVSDKSMNISKMTTFKKSLLTLFGIIISGLLIAWIVYFLQNLSGQSSSVSFILNLLLVLLVLMLIYKTIKVELPGQANSKKDSFFSLIFNLILYIPCVLSGIFDSGVKKFNNVKTASGDNSDVLSSIILLVCTIIVLAVVFIIYYKMPSVVSLFTLQGGKLLVNKPVDTNVLYTLASYEELNGANKFEYQYGLSFWVFLDSNSPSTNSSSNEFVSLLNYGNKPNILYRASTNTLMITMEQKGVTKKKNKLIDFDENGNRIIYKQNNLLLQKWNNIIINYAGGTLDIFFNNELVKSAIEVVPYMTLDNLTIGTNDGINGGICNVVYFKSPLTTTKMYILYNMVKDKTPPISSEANETIIKINS